MVIGASPLFCQDSQFSQFYSNPLYLNPALTGAHSGTYRLTAHYRDQWRGAIESPFTTLSAGGDVKFNIGQGSFSQGLDHLAFGILFFSDRVSIYDYNTTQISIFSAYHKLLSKDNQQYLSAGMQLGLGQRGINYENLTFQDQFDGVNLYNLPTAERLPTNNIAYPDFSLGLHYSVTPRSNQGVYLGISYHHWNRPNVAFFDRDLRTTINYEAYQLDSKITAHLATSFPMARNLAIQPRLIFIKQGEASTTWVGANWKYDLLESNGVSTHFGAWLRSSDSLTTFQPTDIVLSAGFQKNGLLLGFSYDVHLRQLSGNALGQGIFEFSISYIGEHDNVNEICPDF